MKLSPTLMDALSGYWLQKFGDPTDPQVGVDALSEVSANAMVRHPSNIYGIIHNVKCELARLGVSDISLKAYSRYGFIPMLYHFSYFTGSAYSSEAMSELTGEVRQCYAHKKINHVIFRTLLRVASFVEAYHIRGYLEECDLARTSKFIYNISDEFKNLVSVFANRIPVYRSWSQHTLGTCCGSIRGFLLCLEQNGITETSGITRQAVSDGVTQYAGHLGAGLTVTLQYIRIFLRLLFDEGIMPEDLSESVPKFTPRRTVIRNGFSPDEVDRLLASVDKTARLGKRDYAIMLIAARTGLRAVDIAHLRFQSIDWRTNEIKLVQQKTRNPLSLPLMPEVGNAIAAYILDSRPQSSSEYIFVKTSMTAQHIRRQTISALARKYTKLAGINDENAPRRGFHSFRRGFALNLLESDTPTDMLSEILGDVDINSIKPYLAIDENGLRDCAISLIPFESEVRSDVG